MSRNLIPLFAPSSVAVFGASGREGRPGYEIVKALKSYGGPRRIYPITPSYADIEGIVCFADPQAIPERIDLGVIASGPTRILDDAVIALSLGARALHVMGDLDANACRHLAALAKDAGSPLLGPNSIGFIDYVGRTASTWVMPPERHRSPGNIALIMQSGALFSYANAIDPRLKFCATFHLGREADVTLVDVIDHALSMDETKVIGIYLETVGNGTAFVGALERAALRGVPVIVLAPGQTPEAAEAIATHAGRMAGGKASLEALFRRHNVVACVSLDQFWCTLHLFSKGIIFDRGGAVIVTDSGAQRAMAIDAASRAGLPLTRFSKATEDALRGTLAPELTTANPVDIWSGEKDVALHVATCLSTALADAGASVGVVLTEFGASEVDTFATHMAEGALRLAGGEKPVIAIGFSTRHFNAERILHMEQGGLPVLDGLETSFAALAQLRHYQTRKRYLSVAGFSEIQRRHVGEALERLTPNDENAALDLMAAAGIPTVRRSLSMALDHALEAAEAIGYPVVVKTAEPVAHKTEQRGVWLDIADPKALEEAFLDLTSRLGPRVLVASMIKGGVELALGAVVDPLAGPMVMVAAGGVMAELLADRQFALAPVSQDEARDMVRALTVSPTLDPYRGKPGIDREAVAGAIVALSRLISDFPHAIAAVDINPVIATAQGVVAVDALVSPKGEHSTMELLNVAS